MATSGTFGEQVMRRQAKILLVDDNDLVRNVLVASLRADSYELFECGTAVEALELTAQGEKFDLLITDIILPGMDGVMLAHRLKSINNPKLKVIYISSSAAGSEQATQLAKSGAPVLFKPFGPEALRKKIESVLSKKSMKAQE